MRISKELFDYFMQPEISSQMTFQNYGEITLKNGTVIELTPADFRISGNSYQDDIIDSNDFSIGNTIGNTFTINLDNTGRRFDTVEFHDAILELDVGYTYPMPDDDPLYTPGSMAIGAIQFNQLHVINATHNDYTITLDAVDNMIKFDKTFNVSPSRFSSNYFTIAEVVDAICDICDVTNSTTQTTLGHMTDTELEHLNDMNYTYRQVLGYIAQIAGCNAKIDESGALIFVEFPKVPLAQADNIYDFTSVKNVKMGGAFDFYRITGVQVIGTHTEDGTSPNTLTVTVGSTKYPLIVENNPIVFFNVSGTALTDVTEATELAQRLARMFDVVDEHGDIRPTPGFFVTPCSFSCPQNPFIEPGDWVLVRRLNEAQTHKVIVTNVSFTTGGYTTVECKAPTPTDKKAQRSTFSAGQTTQINQMAEQYYNRRVTYDTIDIAVGSDLATGNIYLVYED